MVSHHRSKFAKRGIALVGFAAVLAGRSLLGGAVAHADPSDLPAGFSYNYGEHETPRSAAMGGALHALGGGVTAPLLNPANLGLTRIYRIQALGQFTPEAGRQIYGGVVADSTRRFAGAVSFFGGFIDPDGIDRSFIDARTSLAFALSKEIHLGLTGRYLTLDQEGVGALGPSRASGGLLDAEDPPAGRDALVTTISLDAGATIRATPELHISVVGKNITHPDNGILPTVIGGGIGYGAGDFSIEVDALADFNSWPEVSPRVMGGAEYLIAERVPVRAGYRFDMLAGSGLDASHALSAGAGYLDTRFSVEASVRRTIGGPEATTIVVSAGIYLEALGLPIDEY